MDLSKVPNEKKLYLCKWYFRDGTQEISMCPFSPMTLRLNMAANSFIIFSVTAGFALLPFLWAVNAIWFSKEAFVVPSYEEQKQIRKYVIFSAMGAIIWTTVLLAWIITFQTQRAEWGDFADAISYIIPTGIP